MTRLESLRRALIQAREAEQAELEYQLLAIRLRAQADEREALERIAS